MRFDSSSLLLSPCNCRPLSFGSDRLQLLSFVRLLLLLVVSLSWSRSVSFVEADIYYLEPTKIEQIAPIVRRVVAMYATDDAPLAFAAPNDDTVEGRASYIALDLDINASLATATSANPDLRFVEIVYLAATNLNAIGHFQDGAVQSYCCSHELFSNNYCKFEGRLIINAGDDQYKSLRIPIPLGASFVHVNASDTYFSVTQTSEHLLLIGYCSSEVGSEIEVSGTGKWRNAYGWLPGRLYGFLPFYGYMLIAYGVLTCLWFVIYCRYRSEIAPVQQIISSVLVLSTTEMASWFADYYSFNVVGRRHLGIVILSILLTVTRLALSRVLVVAVSLGFGVTIPRLGSNKSKLIVIGVLYWSFELSLELVTRYSQTNVIAEELRVGLSLPVAVLNALFYWWIFIALQNTMDQLKHDQQTHKLAIYRQFTGVLIFSLIAAVIFAFYQIYFMTTHQFPLHWSYLWLLDGGFSSFLYSLILVMIMMMWRPTEDSQKYAYSELPINQNDELDDNEFGDLELANFDEPDHDNDNDNDNDHDRGNVNAPDMPAYMMPPNDDDDDDRPIKPKDPKTAAKFTVDE